MTSVVHQNSAAAQSLASNGAAPLWTDTYFYGPPNPCPRQKVPLGFWKVMPGLSKGTYGHMVHLVSVSQGHPFWNF